MTEKSRKEVGAFTKHLKFEKEKKKLPVEPLLKLSPRPDKVFGWAWAWLALKRLNLQRKENDSCKRPHKDLQDYEKVLLQLCAVLFTNRLHLNTIVKCVNLL